MVNKQYTVQSGSRKSPNRGSYPLPPNRNVTVLSRIPNPEQKYNVSNIDDLSVDVVKSGHGQDAPDDVLDRSHPYCVEDYAIAEPSTDDDESRNTSDMKDISINDIGRFQYILQMDHEMVSRPRKEVFELFTLSKPIGRMCSMRSRASPQQTTKPNKLQ